MKKSITSILMAGATLFAIPSCTKSGSSGGSTTPTSTFDITINGHSYHITGTTTSIPQAVVASTTSIGGVYDVTVGGGNTTQAIISILAVKSDLSTAIGTYVSDGNNITDYGDGGKVYTIQTGTVNVTISNGHEVKGTFNLTCSYNSTNYPVTGDFDYNH